MELTRARVSRIVRKVKFSVFIQICLLLPMQFSGAV